MKFKQRIRNERLGKIATETSAANGETGPVRSALVDAKNKKVRLPLSTSGNQHYFAISPTI